MPCINGRKIRYLAPLGLAWGLPAAPFNNRRMIGFCAPLGLAWERSGEASLLSFNNSRRIGLLALWGWPGAILERPRC